MSKCPFGCNFNCGCLTKRLILEVNLRCNRRCFYCPQLKILSNSPSILDRDKFLVQINRKEVNHITILGGEPLLLSDEELDFIFYYVRKYNNIEFNISTAECDFESSGIKFTYHITDFDYKPHKLNDGSLYAIVVTPLLLDDILEYCIRYNSFFFRLMFDMRDNVWETLGKKDVFLARRILNLGNVLINGKERISKY